MREADVQEELLSGGRTKRIYREAQVTDAVRRGQRQMLEKEPNRLHLGTPSTCERRGFRLGFRFALLTQGKKVPKAW
jgi:hypothetical protein